MKTVVGVDPGLADTGVGIVRGSEKKIEAFSYTTIHTASQTPLPERLERIYSEVCRILEQERPDLMVVEDVFSLEIYPKSGITLGKVAGIVLLAGCRARLPVLEIPVREAKKTLAGNGNATKAQLERAVRYFLNTADPIRPHHASDAVALAIIGLFRSRREQGRHGLDRLSPGNAVKKRR